MSCTYTCNSGYVFYSGDVTRTVNCSEMNIWNPSPYPESCLSKFMLNWTIKANMFLFGIRILAKTKKTVCVPG